MSAYIPVFINMYTLRYILMLLRLMIYKLSSMQFMQKYINKKSGKGIKLVLNMIYKVRHRLLVPMEVLCLWFFRYDNIDDEESVYHDNQKHEKAEKLEDKSKLQVPWMINIIQLMTIGALFPLLGVIIAVDLWSDMLFLRFALGSFVMEVHNQRFFEGLIK